MLSLSLSLSLPCFVTQCALLKTSNPTHSTPKSHYSAQAAFFRSCPATEVSLSWTALQSSLPLRQHLPPPPSPALLRQSQKKKSKKNKKNPSLMLVWRCVLCWPQPSCTVSHPRSSTHNGEANASYPLPWPEGIPAAYFFPFLSRFVSWRFNKKAGLSLNGSKKKHPLVCGNVHCIFFLLVIQNPTQSYV